MNKFLSRLSFLWRGFRPQFFVFTFLPLSILLVIVAFGSQALHHQAMQKLVAQRDQQIVDTAARALAQNLEASQIVLAGLAAGIEGETLPASGLFDGGLLLVSAEGQLLAASGPLREVPAGDSWLAPDGSAFIVLSTPASLGRLLGAVRAESLLAQVAGGASTVSPLTLIPQSHQARQAVSPAESSAIHDTADHNSAITTYAPLGNLNWALVMDDHWETSADPLLNTTQLAPLVLVPLVLLALAAMWSGSQNIVTPLQKLEKQAARLAGGDFNAIRPPAGGIQEIRSLQGTLILMSEKLELAQGSLHSYIGAITNGIETERRNLACELHDDTLQSLIAINQQMMLENKTAAQRELVEQSITHLRQIVRGLRPIYIEDIGLAAALEMLAHEMQQNFNLPIAFQICGSPQRLPPEREMAVYRMAQEALNNAARHSQASQVTLSLQCAPEGLELTVEDDGTGFSLPNSPTDLAKSGHFGLLGLYERAEMAGARVELQSAPGQGTKLTLFILYNAS